MIYWVSYAKIFRLFAKIANRNNSKQTNEIRVLCLIAFIFGKHSINYKF